MFTPQDKNDEVEAHDLRASGFKGKVMSLFCDARLSFSLLDPDQALDVTHEDTSDGHRARGLSGESGKTPRRTRRPAKRSSDSTPGAYPVSQPRKASLSLNPWKPDPDHSLSSSICGDGLFYAAGGAGACINPAYERSAEAEAGLGNFEVDG